MQNFRQLLVKVAGFHFLTPICSIYQLQSSDNFYFEPHSMGNTCKSLSSTTEFELNNFYNKNQYLNQGDRNEQKIQIILDRIAPGYSNPEYKQIASYIAQQQKMEFLDPKFTELELDQNVQSSSLQKMYNFSRRRLENVFTTSSTPLDILDQREVELCYLCAVFYLICQSQQLKEQIFITRHINPHNAYIIKLFCNGRPCDVVVDESVPTYKQNIKYLSTKQPHEIWPFLLEKAWCKQIGGYNKARGLSPEDCFEEITGIPAYSFSLKQHSPMKNFQILKEAKKSGCWITFTANVNAGKGLRSRQVFHLQAINQKQQNFSVRSPFIDFGIPNRQKPIQGGMQMQLDQIMGSFQYASIGNYVPGFVPSSYSFSSLKDEEVIFQVNVSRSQNINIRLIQFYSQYLSTLEKEYYAYSPVLMQLYDQRYKLIQKCEGRLENIEGVRSSNLSDFIFFKLDAGLYYLRVQVSWQKSQQNQQAHIVTYAPKGVITVKKYARDALDCSARLLGDTLQQQQVQQIDNELQQIKVRYISKTYGYVLGIENTSNGPATLRLIFKDSENIQINHHDMHNNILQIKLDGLQERVLELLPKNPKKQYYLAPFDIIKL